MFRTEVEVTDATRYQPSWLRSWRGALLLTGVTALCAQLSFPLPMTPVPVTMQVFAVLLSGLLLGRRWGFVAQAQYVLLGWAGVPVFALFKAGPAVLFGITGGYLLSYPLAAWVVGSIADSVRRERNISLPARQGVACVAGLAIIYGSGCAWLALMSRPILSLQAALVAGAGWFIVWDAMKAMLAVAVVNVWRRAP